MPSTASADCSDRQRHLLYLSTPLLWPVWPFLPLMRRLPGKEEECGLLFDLLGLTGRTVASATVFLCNLLLVPPDVETFLALPKEVYATPEEIYAGGWRVD
jgi:hypothetical protein